MEYKLSPSDLTFLYNGCKHCFVLKVKHGIPQPSIPLPSVFSTIASLQKDYYSGRRTEDFCPALPPGLVTHGEKWVRSGPVKPEGTAGTCFIAGRFDIVAALDDGSYAVMDFKTGNPSEDKTAMYARQLQAYALALENPAPGALQLSPVSRLGLLYFTPDSCEQSAKDRQSLGGRLQWVEIKRDDAAFIAFLGEVIRLLDGPLPDPAPSTCDWCKFRMQTRRIDATKDSPDTARLTPKCPKCAGPMQLKTGRYGDFWSCLNFPACKGTLNP
jgi:hypothetical protein